MCFSLFSVIPEFKVGKVFKGSIPCTDQLPAKRRILPHPCPECGSDHGSIRIAVLTGTTLPVTRSKLARRFERSKTRKITINKKTEEKSVHFNGKTVVLVRIKHYDASGYSSAQKSMKLKLTNDKEKLRNELMAKQQKWCSFRINEDFVQEFEPITKALTKRFEALNERKSFDFRPTDSFLKAVQEKGWNVFPHTSPRFRKIKVPIV